MLLKSVKSRFCAGIFMRFIEAFCHRKTFFQPLTMEHLTNIFPSYRFNIFLFRQSVEFWLHRTTTTNSPEESSLSWRHTREAKNYASAVWCFLFQVELCQALPMLFTVCFSIRDMCRSCSCIFLTIFSLLFFDKVLFLWICCDRSWISHIASSAKVVVIFSERRRC